MKPGQRKIFPHVQRDQLPREWARSFRSGEEERFTVVVISEWAEPVASKRKEKWADQAIYGMWREREDMVDVNDYVRNLRKIRRS